MRVLSIFTTIALSAISCRAVAVDVSISSQGLAVPSVGLDNTSVEETPESKLTIRSEECLAIPILENAFSSIKPLAQQLTVATTGLDGITSLQDIVSTISHITTEISQTTEAIKGLPSDSALSCHDITSTLSSLLQTLLNVVTSLPSIAAQPGLASSLTALLNDVKNVLQVLPSVDETLADVVRTATQLINFLLNLVGSLTGSL
ncbi:hypothetical protein SERLA73DRAFT_74806 [Serpula lacrymans var. lacrymans S7.3]|uniref:Uncharacterized protein n=2 Tax=Serpula lacrymans var. lacrymans TaxID=341189 RepID=F8Q3K8_SERL3|nr:uncharacterized protein SERLADRAFT_439478 [Serpula lacrymans var. lacrymans S7.9]EGN97093.1 hypothetical protein SERLA73DRAFT_74806 [Serpula lacrymans var. lacrymans S7.3]EGO22700.1 hypothetical protein SERLADRAFT_439478 [Serpula lacrymans var. lacrymans S7.9]